MDFLQKLRPIECLPYYKSHQAQFLYEDGHGLSYIYCLDRERDGTLRFKTIMRIKNLPKYAFKNSESIQGNSPVLFKRTSKNILKEIEVMTPLDRACDYIRAFCTPHPDYNTIAVLLVNMRARKVIRRFSTPWLEILRHLGSLTNTSPVKFGINKHHYLKNSDQLFLDLNYSHHNSGFFQGHYPNRHPKLYLQVLISNFSNRKLRSYEILKQEEKKGIESRLSVLEDGTLTVYNYDQYKDNKINFYLLGGQQRQGVQHYQFSGIKPNQILSFQVLKKIGTDYLVSSHSHFLKIDLAYQQILSSIQYGDKFSNLNDSMSLSESIGQKDFIFLASPEEQFLIGSDTIDVLEINQKSIRTVSQIELSKLLPNLPKLRVNHLIGITASESSKRILLLAEVIHEEKGDIWHLKKNSLVEIEYHIQNPEATRVHLIKKR